MSQCPQSKCPRARFSRRNFLRTGVAAAAALTTPSTFGAAKRSATDWVTLGNSGVKVTRLAFGTGTFGGRVQRELGQEEFTKLVRHAYDRGIRFFESADNYDQMHEMLAIALKGIPRDTYRLMTKLRWRQDAADPFGALDRFRREMNSEYFDIVLLHNVRTPNWPTELERLRDAFSEAKHKQILRAHGASCHGLMPLRAYPGNKWLDVCLARVNHDGTKMDNIRGDNDPGDVNEVTDKLKMVRKQGTGILGMKIIGEGAFRDPEQRQKSIDYVFKNNLADAVTIGYKSPAEIDEAIDRINRALNS